MADANPLDYLYPLDITGLAVTNKVVIERETLRPPVEPLDFHFTIPKAGPYFRDSMVIKHITSGRTLVRGVDWSPGHKFLKASFETQNTRGGLYTSVLLFDRTLSGELEYTEYQTIGDNWTLSENKILEILANRVVDPRSATYEEVSGKPEVFPALPHDHPSDDFTGMVEQVEATYDVATAIRQQTDTFLQNPPVLFGMYYKKTEIDTKFNGVTATFVSYYTKAEVDKKLADLVAGGGTDPGNPGADYYTKVEVNLLITNVNNNFANYYNQTQINQKLALIGDELDDRVTTAQAGVTRDAIVQEVEASATADSNQILGALNSALVAASATINAQ